MDDRTKRQVAANEASIRDINERNVDAADDLLGSNDGDMLRIMCECADEACVEMLSVPRSMYDDVRAVPTRFLVCPEHVVTGAESVIQRATGAWIVEKIDAGAEVAAERA